jgi:adenosylcobinamide kinase / adenosylcobinamide-phosphate guanylyltransferase
MRTLLIGGARSGKSALALRWSNERSSDVCALVTGTESDPEMVARIAAHRRERPAHWRVREEPKHLGLALREEVVSKVRESPPPSMAAGSTMQASALPPSPPAAPQSLAANSLVLVDCLTLWISNCLWPPTLTTVDADYETWRHERADFLDALATCKSDVIIVTNEVGTGIVPNNAASRIFRDEQGWLNQSVAAVCDEVFFVTAGLPLCLKPAPTHTTAPPR